MFTYFHNIYLQRGEKVKLLTALESSFLVAGTAMHLIKLKKHVKNHFFNFFFFNINELESKIFFSKLQFLKCVSSAT